MGGGVSEDGRGAIGWGRIGIPAIDDMIAQSIDDGPDGFGMTECGCEDDSRGSIVIPSLEIDPAPSMTWVEDRRMV